MDTSSSVPSYMQNTLDKDATYYAPEVATAFSNPRLRRLHDAAAAWKRTQRKEAGHASGSTPQQVLKQAALPLSRPNASSSLSPSQPDTQPDLNKSDKAGSAALCTDSQPHRQAPAHGAPATDTDLKPLEESALQWRQARHVLSSPVKSTIQTDNGMNIRIGDPAATSVTMQEAQQGLESHNPAALQRLTDAFSRHDTHDFPRPLLDERSTQVASVPPPPPRPAQQAKATWWDAIKGDAPPWLL